MHTRLVAGMIAAFAVSSAVVSAEQQLLHFEVPPKDVCRGRRIGEPARGAFTQSGSKGSEAPGRMRLCHGGPTKAGVSDVWHADL